MLTEQLFPSFYRNSTGLGSHMQSTVTYEPIHCDAMDYDEGTDFSSGLLMNHSAAVGLCGILSIMIIEAKALGK